MLKTHRHVLLCDRQAYHLGEGRVLKTTAIIVQLSPKAYHLGEGRVLKTGAVGEYDFS